jgi:fucose permease
MASIFPAALSFAEERMHITGRVTGWFFAGSSLGNMFLPWLIGQLFDPFGPTVVMQAIAVDIVITVLVFVVLLLYADRSGKTAGKMEAV